MHAYNMETPFSSSNTHSSIIINFNFETQEEKNQKAIQHVRLDLLNSYKFYDANTLISSIKSVVPFRQPKIKFMYKSFEVLVQSISSTFKETYLSILSL